MSVGNENVLSAMRRTLGKPNGLATPNGLDAVCRDWTPIIDVFGLQAGAYLAFSQWFPRDSNRVPPDSRQIALVLSWFQVRKMMHEPYATEDSVTMSARTLTSENTVNGPFLRVSLPSEGRRPQAISLPVSSPEQSGKQNKKILIIDDDKIVCRVLAMKLQSHGYTVMSAFDGSDGMKAIREQRPDVILLDINFPPDVAHGGGVQWDGFRLLGWMRGMQVSQAPVFFITRTDPAVYRDQVLASGAVGIFHKPLDPEILIKAIEDALNDGGAGVKTLAEN
jgi:CheY-like chemotaxis protein